MTDNPLDDKLTPEEQALFAALPRVLPEVNQLDEERMVRALRQRGMLRTPRDIRTRRAMAFALGIAAALLLFAGGVLLGKVLAARDLRASPPALQVQRAGTEYVAAMVRLSDSTARESRTNLVAGLEAGTATLRAVATSLAQFDPENPVVRRIHASLEAAAQPGDPLTTTTDGRPVVWF